MLESPKIIQTQAQQTAVIRLTVPRDEIRQVMGPGIKEVNATVAAQGIEPAGPWFSHHFKMDPKVFDFELGVPVPTPVTPQGRVQPGELPATRAVQAVYVGSYEGLAAAWGEFDAWIAEQGLTPAAGLWECYARGPESTDDPGSFRTELYRPLS